MNIISGSVPPLRYMNLSQLLFYKGLKRSSLPAFTTPLCYPYQRNTAEISEHIAQPEPDILLGRSSSSSPRMTMQLRLAVFQMRVGAKMTGAVLRICA